MADMTDLEWKTGEDPTDAVLAMVQRQMADVRENLPEGETFDYELVFSTWRMFAKEPDFDHGEWRYPDNRRKALVLISCYPFSMDFGQAYLSFDITIVCPEGSTKDFASFLTLYADTYNNAWSEDLLSRQFANSPDLRDDFFEFMGERRAVFDMDCGVLYTKYGNPISSLEVDGEEIPFFESGINYIASPDSASYAGTRGIVRTHVSQSSIALAFTTPLSTNSSIFAKIAKIMSMTGADTDPYVDTTFHVKAMQKSGVLLEADMRLISYEATQVLGEFPSATISFSI